MNAAIPSVSTRRRYGQVTMGVSNRSDFTKVPQQKLDPGYYDMQDKKTIVDELRKKDQRNDKCSIRNTFGSSFNQY